MRSLRDYILLAEALTPGLPTIPGRNYIIIGSDHKGNAGQPPAAPPDSGQQFQLPQNMPRTVWVEKGEQALGKGIAAQLGFSPLRTVVWDTSIIGPQEKLMQDFILKDIMIAPDPKMTFLAGLMAQQAVWLSGDAARPQPETLKTLAGSAMSALNQPNLPQTQATFNRLKKTSGAVQDVQERLNSIRVESLVSKLTQGGMFIVGVELFPQLQKTI
jgi:hypothetical protein